MTKFGLEEKKRMIDSVPFWWHAIDLGGIVTPGFTHLEIQQELLNYVPDDLSGKTVLDIGAWDGFYSFECEKRGADVTAIDSHQHKEGSFGFKTASKILESNAVYFNEDLYNFCENDDDMYDLVLFFGVFYRLKYPLRALELIAERTKGILLLETHYMKTESEEPLMKFLPGSELKDDDTNWWIQNISGLRSMLFHSGFSEVEVLSYYNEKETEGRVIVKACKRDE